MKRRDKRSINVVGFVVNGVVVKGQQTVKTERKCMVCNCVQLNRGERRKSWRGAGMELCTIQLTVAGGSSKH